MSDYANPEQRVHRDKRFNQYRTQSSGGVDSFDFNGFYLRPEIEKANGGLSLAASHLTQGRILEQEGLCSKDLERTMEEEQKISHQTDNRGRSAKINYCLCGGL